MYACAYVSQTAPLIKYGPVLQIHAGPMRLTSRGFVKVSSSDLFQSPGINFNYLETEFDRREMRDCVRMERKIFEKKAFDES